MKVLIVSHNSFSQTHNNGKTLSSMFSAFSENELCQLYFSPSGEVDLSRCKNYYLIRDVDALKSILKRNKCGSTNVDNVQELPNGIRRGGTKSIVLFLRSLIWRLSSWYSGGLNMWLQEQKPDIVFFVGGNSLFSHRIAWKLSEKINKPLVTFFTDDYIIYPIQNLYTKIVKKYYEKTISQSKILYVIGEKMAEIYSRHFNKVFLPIMNITDIPKEEPIYTNNVSVLTINYFGGIGWARDIELVRFAKFLRQQIEPSLSRQVKIGVYTFGVIEEGTKSELYKYKVDIYKGLTGEALISAMQSTDIFLHVESIEPRFNALTMLSVSTKIPEYMGLSKPIIAFGPKNVASFEVISGVCPKLVIDDNPHLNDDKDQLASLIDTLNNDDALQQISHANYIYAKNHFNKPIVAQKFKEDLLGLV